jgi:hypothetical protein
MEGGKDGRMGGWKEGRMEARRGRRNYELRWVNYEAETTDRGHRRHGGGRRDGRREGWKEGRMEGGEEEGGKPDQGDRL